MTSAIEESSYKWSRRCVFAATLIVITVLFVLPFLFILSLRGRIREVSHIDCCVRWLAQPMAMSNPYSSCLAQNALICMR